MNRLKIVPFEAMHIEKAAEMFARKYRNTVEKYPMLPKKYGDSATVIGSLKWINANYYGVAAFDGDHMVGYLTGIVIPEFKCSRKGVYCPEWGHSAVENREREVYEAMYSVISEQWGDEGCVSTGITILANEKESVDSWFWNGFGMFVIDGARELELLPDQKESDIEIRMAVEADADALVPLIEEHDRYMKGAPTFLDHGEEDVKASIMEWLDNENRIIWLALKEGEIVGCLNSQVQSEDACTIVQDDGTVSILTTHVKESCKGEGIGKIMVNAVLAWAIECGYERCTVDFEAANHQARRFWMKHFEMVCCSLIRYIDDRLVEEN